MSATARALVVFLFTAPWAYLVLYTVCGVGSRTVAAVVSLSGFVAALVVSSLIASRPAGRPVPVRKDTHA